MTEQKRRTSRRPRPEGDESGEQRRAAPKKGKSKGLKKLQLIAMAGTSVLLFAGLIWMALYGRDFFRPELAEAEREAAAGPQEEIDPLLQTLRDAREIGPQFETRIQTAEYRLQNEENVDTEAMVKEMMELRDEAGVWLQKLADAADEFEKRHPGKRSGLNDVQQALQKQIARIRLVLKEVK